MARYFSHVARGNDNGDTSRNHAGPRYLPRPHGYVSPSGTAGAPASSTWELRKWSTRTSASADGRSSAACAILGLSSKNMRIIVRTHAAKGLPQDFYEQCGPDCAFEMPIDKIEIEVQAGQNRSRRIVREQSGGLVAEGSPEAPRLQPSCVSTPRSTETPSNDDHISFTS